MANINILDYEIHSAQGDIKETLKSMQNDKIESSFKTIMVDSEDVKIPFFAFKDEVQQSQISIKNALRELLLKIVPKMDDKQKARTSLIVGTALIDCNLMDAVKKTSYGDEVTPYYSHKNSIDTYAKELSYEFGLNEFTMTINTACTSSVNALLEASNLIECGVVDYALVVGLEIFSPIMSSGFYTMSLLSNTRPKPFDKDRDGIVLGEGLGVILLGRDESKWSLLGGFSNCNSATITSVSQSGAECVEVIEKALENSNLSSEDITALKAHGTGSHSNDEAEINAIARVFDDSLIFTALKPYVGHTIGASGVLEISLFMAAIDEGYIPKTLSCSESILENYSPITKDVKCKDGIFMCNYFGFGGNNTSLIIKREA